MAKIPYFPFYPDDYLSSPKVLKMSDAQRGVYVHLLCLAWKHPGCKLPLDIETIQLMCPRSKKSNIEYVLRECFEVVGDGLANMRMTAEHGKAILKSEKTSKSANYRWKKEKQNADAVKSQCEGNDNQNQNQNQNHKKKNLKNSVPAKTAVTDLRIKQTIDYFFTKCQEVRGFKPAINGGQDGKRVQAALRIMSEDELRSCIDYFLTSKKADELGVTLAIALSSHSLNLFRQGRGNDAKSRLERIFGIRGGSSVMPGSVHRETPTGRGSKIVDSEAYEIPEVEDAPIS